MPFDIRSHFAAARAAGMVRGTASEDPKTTERETLRRRARLWTLAGGLLGAAVFLALYGVRVLDPTEMNFMLCNGSDPPSTF